MIGMCGCGCGQATKIAVKTDSRQGWIKGQPHRFLRGHNAIRRSAHERFWEKVERTADCWIWRGGKNDAGYGTFAVRGRRAPMRAHVWAWEQSHGPVPEGLQLDHLCRNRACVNPAHLEPVTSAENTRRGRTAKLDWDSVEAIRGSTEPAGLLAERYGVSTNRIYDIRSGIGWVPKEAIA